MNTLTVAAKSDSVDVAGAIAGQIKAQGFCEVRVIGAAAVNQTVKAIAIARGITAPGGVDLICAPAFQDLEIDGEERTAIMFLIEPRPIGSRRPTVGPVPGFGAAS